ncbi:major facilitator superfamily domain-containing protein [Kockovaella imperatae]|uniref:Major facilitator superfamily domain-containing protein n=1 Tax=Kockovaella imperatae TaxID=4999 RepID=A0A1Y1UN55_9TREE|nr:major facilitator superfamily domain-containing protein [Kockovaella imperatae]ORX38886.1 major facilitator superfamily domain-containing protein [Kockovaella imperatae]
MKSVTPARETTPLLPKHESNSPSHSGWFPPIRRVMFTACLLSLTFAFTQTSLIYSFRTMTCNEYYKHHAWDGPEDKNRCAIPRIESSTAASIALMSSTTTMCTLLNLFVTGYWIKRFGPKAAMFQQTAWAAMRNLTQIYAQTVGGATGIKIIQTTQLFNIMGSGGGYGLAANSFIAFLAEPEERTSQFGVLGGIMMLGAAGGYTFGGLSERLIGPLAPFQFAFGLLVFCTIFGSLFLPYFEPEKQDDEHEKQSKSFLSPLKVFVPVKKEQPDGRLKRDWNLFLLGSGAFFSVLATGYVGMALQLVATNVFAFGPADSGIMLSIFLLMKAFFLSLLFPRIIKSGRQWLSKSPASEPITRSSSVSSSRTVAQEDLDDPVQAEEPTVVSAPQHNPAPAPTDVKHGSLWDLYFLRGSIFLDGFLTSWVSLAHQGWHMYLAAVVLPFASGTGSACKGVTLDFVGPDERADALSAIALVEKLAQVSTVAMFGTVFSALSEVGRPLLIFLANGAIAMVGCVLLLCVKLPRQSGVMI